MSETRSFHRSSLRSPALRVLPLVLACGLLVPSGCGGEDSSGSDGSRGPVALEDSDGYAAFRSGLEYAQRGNHDKAASEFQTAVRLDSFQPEFLHHYGKSLAALGQDSYAQQAFERGLELMPRHPGILKEMGALEMRSNRLQESVAYLRRSIEVDPSQADVHFHLGRSLIYLSDARMGSMLRDQERLDEGIGALGEAVRLDPGNAEYNLWLGKAWEAKNDQDKALEYFQAAAASDENNLQAWLGIGAIQGMRGELDAAREAITKAMEVAPDSQEALFEYGLMLEQDGDLEKAIEINPASPQPHFRLANVLSQLGDEDGHARAMAEFERWSELNNEYQFWHGESKTNPGDPEVLARLGEMQYLMNEPDRALLTFASVLKLDNKHGDANAYSGMILREAGELPQAAFHLSLAAKVMPENEEVRRAWVSALLENGDQPLAKEALESILADHPDDEWCWYNLGVIEIALGNLDVAGEHFRAALEANEDYTEARYALAGVYYSSEQWEEAAAEYRRILNVQPDHPDAKHYLELALNEGAE